VTTEPDPLEHLGAAVRGRVVLPTHAGWDEARQGWNLAVDQRPAAVVEAADAEDVHAVVRIATQTGLRVAPQSTGHGAEALGPLDGALLLKTSAMRDIAVDPGARVAKVGAGALAADVAAAAGEHRLAPVLGLAPSVGVAGLTLGGGIGWLSRSYGLAANNVRALDVVLASGERRRVDADAEPELFWALRGGGGRAAIVTALELELHPVDQVSAGMLVWPAEHVGEVLGRFRAWTQQAPESLSAVFRYLAVPDLEEVPPPLRGRRVVAIIAAHLGTEADGRALVEPLRASGETLVDTFGPVGPGDLVRVAGDPDQPAPARGDGFLLDDLTVELVEAIAGLVSGDALAPLGVLELRHLGGALGRAPAGHGALASLAAGYSFFAGGPAFDDPTRVAIGDRIDGLRTRLAPWTARQALLNVAAAGVDVSLAFGADAWERLRHAGDEYDPDRLLLVAHDPAHLP